jgi:hypothetical protein
MQADQTLRPLRQVADGALLREIAPIGPLILLSFFVLFLVTDGLKSVHQRD